MDQLFDPMTERPATAEGGRRYAIVLSPRTLEVPRRAFDEALWRGVLFAGVPSRVMVSAPRHERTLLTERLERWPGIRRIEHPLDLDTAPAVLLPLLDILIEDLQSTVLVLPSSGTFGPDREFVDAFDKAFEQLSADPTSILLFGSPDPKASRAGWIVPEPGNGWPRRAVLSELPTPGALGDTRCVVARATTLAAMFRDRASLWWRTVTEAFFRPDALEAGFRQLPPSSFRDDVLRTAPNLRVVAM